MKIVLGVAMAGFVGRRRELALLAGMLGEVREQVGAARPGKCVIVRGRRRIGKSALVEEFIERQQVPSVFYTALPCTTGRAASGPCSRERCALSVTPPTHPVTGCGSSAG